MASTHFGYCKAFYGAIADGKLNINQTRVLGLIINKLSLIFGLDEKRAVEYIIKYFEEEQYLKFQEAVMYTQEYLDTYNNLLTDL